MYISRNMNRGGVPSYSMFYWVNPAWCFPAQALLFCTLRKFQQPGLRYNAFLLASALYSCLPPPSFANPKPQPQTDQIFQRPFIFPLSFALINMEEKEKMIIERNRLLQCVWWWILPGCIWRENFLLRFWAHHLSQKNHPSLLFQPFFFHFFLLITARCSFGLTFFSFFPFSFLSLVLLLTTE